MKKIIVPLIILLISACTLQKDKSFLSHYDFTGNYAKPVLLPEMLREISGITFTSDGRVFAEEDEHGIIYQINLGSGKVIKTFSLGDFIIKDDFEDITVIKNKFYLVTSNGIIYEFSEGKDKEKVNYKKYNTGLTSENNIEGMCFDPVTNSLLLACKDFPGKGYDDSRTVYSFSLIEKELEKKPRFIIPINYVTQKLNVKNFRPSGIARNPQTGTFFIISAHSKVIIEISKEGKIIALEKLSKKNHNQPEGITFTSDGSLIISDEGEECGQITIYHFKV